MTFALHASSGWDCSGRCTGGPCRQASALRPGLAATALVPRSPCTCTTISAPTPRRRSTPTHLCTLSRHLPVLSPLLGTWFGTAACLHLPSTSPLKGKRAHRPAHPLHSPRAVLVASLGADWHSPAIVRILRNPASTNVYSGPGHLRIREICRRWGGDVGNCESSRFCGPCPGKESTAAEVGQWSMQGRQVVQRHAIPFLCLQSVLECKTRARGPQHSD